jgi:hypothetical protein
MIEAALIDLPDARRQCFKLDLQSRGCGDRSLCG